MLTIIKRLVKQKAQDVYLIGNKFIGIELEAKKYKCL